MLIAKKNLYQCTMYIKYEENQKLFIYKLQPIYFHISLSVFALKLIFQNHQLIN